MESSDLATIFRMQRELNDLIVKRKMPNKSLPSAVSAHADPLDPEKAWWLEKYTQALIHEAVEAQRELPIKWWSTRREYSATKVSEELIDCLHFLVSAMLMNGMSADDVMTAYTKKYAVNVNRAESNY
jgi:dimeric dUTPase (all-alpha-NTP-PPase superfamily)